MKSPTKGQGAQTNINNRFESVRREHSDYDDEVEEILAKTSFLEVFPKTIVNKVKSPDVPSAYSMNPYQGCEHGCAYCYARPTHEYWGYSAGIDFERTILVKKNAPELLEKFFQKKNHQPAPIMLSGNTDCYQPIERKLKITQELLNVCLTYRHPVSLITKNSLILRDLDILKKLNQKNLVNVAISITTLDESLRRKLEPRTASVQQRLKTVNTLSENGIPTMVMIAPLIPALNSHEVLPIAKKVAEMGALNFGYTMVRLNDTVEPVFEEWVKTHFPDRADKVLNQIKSLHGGKLGEKRYKLRMKGEGNIAEMIRSNCKIARQKYFPNAKSMVLSTEHFDGKTAQQLKLF